MLEGINSVNWKEIEHAYGPAEDVPDLIRALASDNPDKRENARTDLWGTIIHQGTVCSATAHAVPFLLELLASPLIKDKPHLLVLVASLACGSSYLDVHQDLFEDVPSNKEDMQKPEWGHRLQTELGWVKAAYEAVGKGWTVYLQLLDDPDPRTRCCAAYALAVCRQHASETVSPLRDHLPDESDDRVTASILLCLGCVGGEECKPLCEEWLTKGRHPLVRTSAALSLARLCRDHTPQPAVEVLAECLDNPGAVDELYYDLPWSQGESVVSAAGQALAQLGPASASTIVPQIAEGLKNLRQNDTGSLAVVGALLALAFEPQKEPRLASSLSELQRLVLTKLVESDRVWDFGTVFFVLSRFGFPSDRKELAELLGLPTEGLGEGFVKTGSGWDERLNLPEDHLGQE